MPIKHSLITTLIALFLTLSLSTSYSQDTRFIEEVNNNDLPSSIRSTITDRVISINNEVLTKSSLSFGSSREFKIGLGITESPRVFMFKQNKILSDNFNLRLSSGKQSRMGDGSHYSGRHEDGSLIAISLFEDGAVFGVVIDKAITYDIETISEQGRVLPSLFRLVKVKQLPEELSKFCHTDTQAPEPTGDFDQIPTEHTRTKVGGPVDMHLECDFEMFSDFGSIAATTTYITGLMNVVFTLFSDEGVAIQISELVIWDSLDPYGAAVQGTNTGVILNAFKCELENYNGRIAHLLSTAGGLGGRADRPSHTNCPSQNRNYGFSAIFETYDPDLTNYSWSINVIAHEIGHQMSAHHTHDCVWNGNDTQIDDCGNALAVSQGQNPNACFDENAPIIPANAQGTIMSYCHTGGGTGVNLALGFNDQIGTRMFNFATTCLGDLAPNICSAPTETELAVEVLSATSISVTTSISSANFWTVGYIPTDGSTNWICHSGCSASAATSALTINGLDPTKTYQIQAIQFCTSAGVWSAWSCYFLVDDLIQENCTTTSGTINSGNANSTIITSANTLGTTGTVLVNTLTPLTWQSQMSVEINSNVTLDPGVTLDVSIGPCND